MKTLLEKNLKEDRRGINVKNGEQIRATNVVPVKELPIMKQSGIGYKQWLETPEYAKNLIKETVLKPTKVVKLNTGKTPTKQIIMKPKLGEPRDSEKAPIDPILRKLKDKPKKKDDQPKVEDWSKLSKRPEFKRLEKYKKGMIETLSYKGLDFSGKPLAQIANAFYTNIVAKDKDNYQCAMRYGNVDLDEKYQDNLNDTAINSIVEGVTGYVGNVLKKEENLGRENLSKFEQFLADKFGIVKVKAESSAKKEAATKLGESLLFGKTGIIIGLVLLVLLIIVFKK